MTRQFGDQERFTFYESGSPTEARVMKEKKKQKEKNK